MWVVVVLGQFWGSAASRPNWVSKGQESEFCDQVIWGPCQRAWEVPDPLDHAEEKASWDQAWRTRSQAGWSFTFRLSGVTDD